MSMKYVSISTSIVNVLVWGCAAIFACKQHGFIMLYCLTSGHNIGFLIIAGYVAVGGAIISVLAALFNYRRRISLLIQIAMLLLGTGVLWAFSPLFMI